MPDGKTDRDPPARSQPALILGLDFGERRIGIAAGDTLTRGARPLGVVATIGGQPDWKALGRYVREWQPQVLIVGVPCNMDGTAGRLTGAAKRFAAELRERFSLETIPVDERLSSHEAEDRLRQQRASGERPRRVRPGDIDSAAACVLLEQWLREQPRRPQSE
jgi:putative Holliday junction resolvase